MTWYWNYYWIFVDFPNVFSTLIFLFSWCLFVGWIYSVLDLWTKQKNCDGIFWFPLELKIYILLGFLRILNFDFKIYFQDPAKGWENPKSDTSNMKQRNVGTKNTLNKITLHFFFILNENSFSLEATKAPNINFSHFPIYMFVWLDSFYVKNSITQTCVIFSSGWCRQFWYNFKF